MRPILIPVLDQTTVDGTKIDDEWLKTYGPTAIGKPANLDHNYYNTSNKAVGNVDNVFFDPQGRLYAVISIFDEIYWEIDGHIKGCSIEWNTDPSGNEGLIRAIAICVNSTPKVDFAKGAIITEVLASIKEKLDDGSPTPKGMFTKKEITEMVASVKEKLKGDNMGEPQKISDMTIDQFNDHLKKEMTEIMASYKPQDGTPGATPKEGGEGGEPTEITASHINDLTATLKTVAKEIGAVRAENKEIMASIKTGAGANAGDPPGGSGGEEIVASVEIDL
ncbi:hypothetical protein [Methanococcus maripaludis]|uniref:Uncharacterized protein n=1 Tax=Methanococcus maripaludis TaxID=39152 RepID=A0A8T4H2L5_METMI|nr:hypothetical protein [Methanococcus maripaludis]MBM7408781.1 hypothetical protein [Methanococcus maripaludis]MBP2219050.1 hypothetical protein [Methanococcus maripaludis]